MEFIRKITSTKAGKIIFCLVVAIPIWLISLWINKEPENKITTETRPTNSIQIVTEPETPTTTTE